ncbi:MAG: membrane protein insertion efficiency factor YidD [Bacteroidetes bacterium]|nr:membrane protein insertion efficiency factor YidD [Bacteroidota bacterium]
MKRAVKQHTRSRSNNDSYRFIINFPLDRSERNIKHGLQRVSEGLQASARWLIRTVIRLYQLTISPWLGPSCRHSPTCSAYMMEAVQEWGATRGVWMGIKRLSKCHPWGTSGYDPVPSRKNDDTEEDT